MDPKQLITHGNNFPFDAPDSWWTRGAKVPPKPKDWAHSAARGIIASLHEIPGIKNQLSRANISESTRAEIVDEIASIIRAAAPRA